MGLQRKPNTNNQSYLVEIKKKMSGESNGKLTESTAKNMKWIPKIKFTKLFINGQFVDSISGSISSFLSSSLPTHVTLLVFLVLMYMLVAQTHEH